MKDMIEGQEISGMNLVCQPNTLTIESDAATLFEAADALLQEAKGIHAQVVGDPEFYRELTRTIDSLETAVSELQSSNDTDLQPIKLKLLNKFRVLDVLICGDTKIFTEVNHEIELAMQALTAEKERTGNTFPEIDALVKANCDRLLAAAGKHSIASIHDYDQSLHDVIDFMNSIPAPAARPLDLSLLAIGCVMGAGAMFAFLLLAYLFARPGCVSRVGIFSNNYRAVHNSDEDDDETLELEGIKGPEQAACRLG